MCFRYSNVALYVSEVLIYFTDHVLRASQIQQCRVVCFRITTDFWQTERHIAMAVLYAAIAVVLLAEVITCEGLQPCMYLHSLTNVFTTERSLHISEHTSSSSFSWF